MSKIKVLGDSVSAECPLPGLQVAVSLLWSTAVTEGRAEVLRDGEGRRHALVLLAHVTNEEPGTPEARAADPPATSELACSFGCRAPWLPSGIISLLLSRREAHVQGADLHESGWVARVPHLDTTNMFLYCSLEHLDGIKPSVQGGPAISIPFTDFSPSTALLFPLPHLCFLGPPLK